jgi:hypothetical protein
MSINKAIPLKKRDRVSFYYQEKIQFGVIVKGGSKKVIVRLDGAGGLVSNSPLAFNLSPEPFPAYPKSSGDDILDCSVKNGLALTKNGMPFQITFKRNKIPIFTLTDKADGGMMSVELLSEYTDKDYSKYHSMAQDWFFLHGGLSDSKKQELERNGDKHLILLGFSEWLELYSWSGVDPSIKAKEILISMGVS